jgi:hypothetical protein
MIELGLLGISVSYYRLVGIFKVALYLVCPSERLGKPHRAWREKLGR